MLYSTNGSKEGTIFCIHGNSSSAKVFEGIMRHSDIKYQVIAVDLPGHGENQSEAYQLSDFSFKSNISYIKKCLSQIDGDVLLVGNSLGGHLAIEVAAEVDKVKGLVIMGTPPVKSPINFQEAFNPIPELNLFFEEHPNKANLASIPQVALVNKAKEELLIQDFIRTNPLVRRAIKEDLVQSVFADEYEMFTELKIPTFILQGDKDPSVNRDYLREVYHASKGSCELIRIEECGHYPSIDNAEAFSKKLLEISDKVFSSK